MIANNKKEMNNTKQILVHGYASSSHAYAEYAITAIAVFNHDQPNIMSLVCVHIAVAAINNIYAQRHQSLFCGWF